MCLQECLLYVEGAMTGNFDSVVARVGMWRAVGGNNYLVEQLTIHQEAGEGSSGTGALRFREN